jgi:hypothetical protein
MVNLVLYWETIWTIPRWQINLHTLNANLNVELYSHNMFSVVIYFMCIPCKQLSQLSHQVAPPLALSWTRCNCWGVEI